MSDPIEVHILSGKKGESIVVRLPGNLWGVVDNYTPHLDKPESSPTFRFLQDRGVTKLGFLCLTHPHEDHYRGISHLLEVFQPDRIWIFGSLTHRDLYTKVAVILKAGACSKNRGKTDFESVDELVRFLDLIREQCGHEGRNPPLDLQRLTLGLPLLEIDSSPPIRVVSIGAPGRRIFQYEATLDECFDNQGGFLADRLPNVNHNMISGGLLIEYGAARIVLGGDIDSPAWQETMVKFASPKLNSKLVKVSHHGSTTGYCDGLWQELSPGQTAIAVITPYTRHGLPSSEGLAHISGNAKLTLTTSLAGVAQGIDWQSGAIDTSFRGLSTDALLILRQLFPKAANSSDRLEGTCSFGVHHDGGIAYSLAGAAGILSSR